MSRPWHRRLRQQEWADDAACQNKHLEHVEITEEERPVYIAAEAEPDPDGEEFFARGNRDIFFPPRIKHVYDLEANIAKDYCLGLRRRTPCPVRMQCLLYAIDRDEEHGIWGGMSHRERNAMVRKAESRHQTVVEYLEINYPEEIRTDFPRENY